MHNRKDCRDGWKIAVAGECMLNRTFSMHEEPEFRGIKDILSCADVCYGHLEMNFSDFTACPSRGNWIGSYLQADPEVAKDLRWLGIDVMSLANNHSYDFGAPGLLDTIRHCQEADLVTAGTGRDLEAAREPGYWEGKAGRVALISTATGNGPDEWANLAKGTMAARPGINPLRIKMRFKLPHKEAEELRSIGKNLGILRVPGAKIEGNTPIGLDEGEFRLFMPSDQSKKGIGVFCEAEEFGIESECDPLDLEGNLRSVTEAQKLSDFVMVAHHFNLAEGKRGDVPPSFAVKFAHDAIDAGADVYFGHGWHKTLGVEIYKGKPIFYGLGNFFAQSQFIRRIPYDSYETWGHDMGQLINLRPSDEPLHPGLDRAQATWWSSALIRLEYDRQKQIKKITFHPVELGRDVTKEAPITRYTGSYAEGRPMLATGENARNILERFQELSKPFGTEIKIDGDLGYWGE
ncbi:CapA family protein [Enterocloster asparagiformis]|uniref:CapA family protein n=1 Tax=Enterocloster asparagiformis TaxID=333367 RepID=UPI000464F153|nr:CapA family protein [Enterocloster asparagiformis]